MLQAIVYIILLLTCFSATSYADMSVIISYQSKDISAEGPEKNLAMTTLEAGPSAIVAGCVSAISGDFFDSSTDLIVPGANPLTVQRNYCSSEKKWTFHYMPKLSIATSEGGNHLCAGLRDDNGSGIVYQAYNDSFNWSLNLPKKMIKKGLTNVGSGVISGQTNWKNTSIKSSYLYGKDVFILFKGDSSQRIFSRYKKLGRWDSYDVPLGKFHLKEEILPHGNKVKYQYDSDNALKVINSVNNAGELLASLKVSSFENETSWHAKCGSVKYFFSKSRKNLLLAKPDHSPNVSFHYDSKHRMIRKEFPNSRYLGINYHEDGKNKGRVKHLLGPVGVNHNPQVTHTFHYSKKDDFQYTSVYDAAGIRTEYKIENSQLQEITYFDKLNSIYSIDKFYWGSGTGPDAGNLTARLLYTPKKIFFYRELKYDSFGNVTQDILWGNLTGRGVTPIFGKLNQVETHRCESYVKCSRSSQDGKNLVVEESDGRKGIHFTYYSGSNLLKQRTTQSGNTIFKREYFEYDKNGVLIKEIIDDGFHQIIKRITPTTNEPIGLPHIIEEMYLDSTSGAELLLKRTVNQYSSAGKLTQQSHFDSEGNLAYILFWKYDSHHNVIKESNPLGEISTYAYDENDNKIAEYFSGRDYHKEYTYDYANRLIKEEEIWSNGKRFSTSHRYDLTSRRIATVDTFGNETYYFYDAFGRVIRTQYPAVHNKDGSLVFANEYAEYDAMGNKVAEWDSQGNCTRTEYTVRGKPYKITYPNGSVERKEYTLDGLLACEIAKNGLMTKYTYDSLGRVILTETLDNGTVIKSKSTIYRGMQIASEIDEMGQVTTYEYDGAGRQIAVQKGNRRTEFMYDALGRQAKVIEASRILEKKYDLLDRVIEETVIDDHGRLFSKKEFRYDASGNCTHKMLHTNSGAAVTQTEYNPHGEPTKIIDPLGHVTYISYDEISYRGQKVRKTTKTDPNGNQQVAIYDTQKNIAETYCIDPFGQIIQSETCVYDLLDQKVQSCVTVYEGTKQLRQILTLWDYDRMGNVIHTTEAKGTPEQKEIFYRYNAFGEKEQIIKPDGIVLFHQYDRLGRVTAFFSSDKSIHYSYIYNVKDQLTQVKDHINQTNTCRSYYDNGTLCSETLDNGCTLHFNYDDRDRLTLLTLPDSSSISYRYDAENLIAVDRINEGITQYTHRYTDYDLSGELLREEHIGQAGVSSYHYDLLQRPVITHAPHWNESHIEYDAVSNLLKRTATDMLGSIDYEYSYDHLYQLTSEKGPINHCYQHDSLYNRTNKDSKVYAVNALNQLLHQGDTTYIYDRNGNLIEKNQAGLFYKYRYDALDRLIEYTDGSYSTIYAYDSFHRRMAKKQNGITTHYFYHGENELGAQIDEQIVQLRVLGLSRGAEIGAAVAIELNDVSYAPIHDSFGNVVALVDAEGTPVSCYRYTAFGEVVEDTDQLGNPWRFSSKRIDAETGFIYFGRRYYIPEIGRWITPDPAGYADGPNLYAYVHNNPLAYIDPDGQLAWFLIPMAISMVAEYCVPAATAYLAEYAGGVALGAFLTGALQGYNGSVLEPSAYASADWTTYLSNKAGMCVGAAIALHPGNAARKGSQIVTNLATRELSLIGTKAVATTAKRVVQKTTTEMTKKTAVKVTQKAEQYITKEKFHHVADYIVGPNGLTIPTNRAMLETGFQKAGFKTFKTTSDGMGYVLPNGNFVRIMEPSGKAPLRASFTNNNHGPINPFTGSPPQPPKGLNKSLRLQFVREQTHLELIQ